MRQGAKCWFLLILGLVLAVASASAQQPSAPPADSSAPAATPAPAATDSPAATTQTPSSAPAAPGSIAGTVLDPQGAPVNGAGVSLKQEGQTAEQHASTTEDGKFAFSNLIPGTYTLTFTLTGFANQSTTAVLASGQTLQVPSITLAVATNFTEVKVELTPIEIAQEQLKDQEKQRILGVIPNFYVSYVPDAQPLSSKQKFQLALKSTIDPVSIGVTAAVAGIEQATNHFPGYGQGAEGYAKRFGATYADFSINLFIGGAILPSLLKQDPRYFYKGTGSVGSRAGYAIANAVICKGDNGKWQPNYSEIIGSLAAGGISNLYYPASDRNGISLTLQNTLIGIGSTAAINLLQEFVIKKFTSNRPASANSKGTAGAVSRINFKYIPVGH